MKVVAVVDDIVAVGEGHDKCVEEHPQPVTIGVSLFRASVVVVVAKFIVSVVVFVKFIVVVVKFIVCVVVVVKFIVSVVVVVVVKYIVSVVVECKL